MNQSNKTILITGGSGLIGTALNDKLLQKGYDTRILTRSPKEDNEFFWDPVAGKMDVNAIKGVDYIIHLAGAGIADKRWTEKRKKEIIESRTSGPKLMHKMLGELGEDIKGFISSSGISYYGVITSDKIFEESDPPGEGFVPECVIRWEAAADLFKEHCRIVKLRTGIVLSKDGGALPRIATAVKWGVGAPVGSGKQWMAWIHLDDVVDAYIFALENNIEGTFNIVADNPVTNKTFTKALARAMNKPFFMPRIPGFVLKALYGEMASLVLNGVRVSNKKLKRAGFKYSYDDISVSLRELYKK